MHPLFRLAVVLLMPLLVSCVTSIVKRPGVNEVQKVAIISVYASRGIKNVDGQSGGLTSQLSTLGSMANDSSESKPLDFGGTRIVEYGLTTYEQKLGQVPGWKIVPFSSFKNNPAYTKFMASQREIVKASTWGFDELAYVAVPGASPVYVHKDMYKDMADLAKALNVDAVGVIQLDVAYQASTSIGGTGTASAALGTSLHFVNKKGEVAIQTFDAGSGRRFKSSRTTGMIAGNIAYGSEVEAMFKESVDNGAHYYSETIAKDLTTTKE